MDMLHVDCATCVARGPSCEDCVITVLLGAPAQAGRAERRRAGGAVRTGQSGLVPPLRLIPGARTVREVQSPIDWQDYA